MKFFNWNNDKNKKLKQERGISFEEVVFFIERGSVVDIIQHPNQKKYKGQKIYVVNINNYIYLIPVVESENEVFLKTIIPSRKMTKIYLGKENEHDNS